METESAAWKEERKDKLRVVMIKQCMFKLVCTTIVAGVVKFKGCRACNFIKGERHLFDKFRKTTVVEKKLV